MLSGSEGVAEEEEEEAAVDGFVRFLDVDAEASGDAERFGMIRRRVVGRMQGSFMR